METPQQIPKIKEIIRAAVPLKQKQQLDQLVEKIASSRIVMLGEATHGTSEFYEWRRLISQRLIENHGFSFIAVEGDWPDCWRLNRYIETGNGKSAKEVMKSFNRWPTWMWANEESERLIEWMKVHGGHFYGLDVYSLFDSIEVVRAYARRLSPALASSLMEAYQCFDTFGRNEKAYAKSLAEFPRGCQDEVVAALRKLLRLRLEQSPLDEKALLDARQNAWVIRNAEKYYRSMFEGEEESWNVRDEHMLQILDNLLHHHGAQAKAIVWAHNTHIGDYHATDMLRAGYINLGGLAREKYGIQNVQLVGFGTYAGEVLAGRAWGAPGEVMKLPEARAGSIENQLHQVAQALSTNQFYMPLESKQDALLSGVQGHRAVGVVYESDFEFTGHNYVPTSLANRYDAFVFVDHTHALKALQTPEDRRQFPETWPSGT